MKVLGCGERDGNFDLEIFRYFLNDNTRRPPTSNQRVSPGRIPRPGRAESRLGLTPLEAFRE